MATDPTDNSDFDAFVDEHRALRSLLADVHAEIDGACDRARLISLLDQLAGQLTTHFKAEESGGYFDEALTRAPQLSKHAQVLLDQHPTLLRQAEEVRQAIAGDELQLKERVRARFDAFRGDLAAHEEAENSLMMEAYDRDMGDID